MKTKELIEQLQGCDPDGEVYVQYQDDYGLGMQIAEYVTESKANGNAFIQAFEYDKDAPTIK